MLQISAMCTDIMREGLRADETRDDVSWWIEKQKEIEFAFGVLEGMGLANRVTAPGENEVSIWSPSRMMKRIYGSERNHRRYRRARDEQLRTILAGRLTAAHPNKPRLRAVPGAIDDEPIS